MTSTIYQDVLKNASQLTTEEQLQLLADLAALIRQQTQLRPPESILEYEGVAKDAWAGIDAQEYVNQERDSWDG